MQCDCGCLEGGQYAKTLLVFGASTSKNRELNMLSEIYTIFGSCSKLQYDN